MAKQQKVQPGTTITIPAGTRVSRCGNVSKRSKDSTITVRRTETTRAGNVKVFWKSNGYMASAILK